MKVTSKDILAILRRFELANDDNVPRHIEMVKTSNPSPLSTLVSFRFSKQQLYILFDDTAEDDVDYVLSQIKAADRNITGELIKNPNDHITTYALPYRRKECYVFVVVSDKKRLDSELAERYPELSRSTWQKHIKAGHVSVNDIVVTSPKHDVLVTDKIAIDTPDAPDFSKDELPIIFIDDNVIVINKPAGVLTHAKGALSDEFTVAEFFRRYSDYNSDTNRPGIVHRLDRDTSGVMIGARNEDAAKMLQKQFADRTTKKSYVAILAGIPKTQKANIDLPIGRNPSAPSTFRVDSKGKSALTKYEVLAIKDDLALVKLQPKTGRTHQLRVHMRYINTPILGDKVYGKSADRLYLHAKSLEVTIPGGERRVFEAPLLPEFINLFPEVDYDRSRR
ncbi:MAG TPA: RluA family pseudouridine synthase [Candidatus Saccharimonadales bacterium]|nr:RluA family pseudouridine synthase [Candidatus Saccharimonadales bacterium]